MALNACPAPASSRRRLSGSLGALAKSRVRSACAAWASAPMRRVMRRPSHSARPTETMRIATPAIAVVNRRWVGARTSSLRNCCTSVQVRRTVAGDPARDQDVLGPPPGGQRQDPRGRALRAVARQAAVLLHVAARQHRQHAVVEGAEPWQRDRPLVVRAEGFDPAPVRHPAVGEDAVLAVQHEHGRIALREGELGDEPGDAAELDVDHHHACQLAVDAQRASERKQRPAPVPAATRCGPSRRRTPSARRHSESWGRRSCRLR